MRRLPLPFDAVWNIENFPNYLVNMTHVRITQSQIYTNWLSLIAKGYLTVAPFCTCVARAIARIFTKEKEKFIDHHGAHAPDPVMLLMLPTTPCQPLYDLPARHAYARSGAHVCYRDLYNHNSSVNSSSLILFIPFAPFQQLLCQCRSLRLCRFNPRIRWHHLRHRCRSLPHS